MIGLQRLAIPSCPLAKCPPAKRPQFSLDLPAIIVVFIDILPNWGLFVIIKQICHASVGILMECLPEGKPSSLWGTFHQDTYTGKAYLYNDHLMDGFLISHIQAHTHKKDTHILTHNQHTYRHTYALVRMCACFLCIFFNKYAILVPFVSMHLRHAAIHIRFL